MSSPGPLDYATAGVDMDLGDRLIEDIAPLVNTTHIPGVLDGLGGFAGSFGLKEACPGMRDPVLVACTDGVGTKLEVAQRAGRHDGIGIDLVAMSVNDLIVCGARPLFFLDYLVTDKLEAGCFRAVLKGIVAGCRQAGCALLGGETAAHPGTFPAGRYDLAGFCVGVVERERRIDARALRGDELILGLASSGPHSNGFSLLRRVVFEVAGLDVHDPIVWQGCTLGSVADVLLTPTRIYVAAVTRALAVAGGDHGIAGMAHITGGGLPGNAPRMLSDHLAIELWRGSWPVPPFWDWIKNRGGISDEEMTRVFNLGLGFLLAVRPERVAQVREALEQAGERVFEVGRVRSRAPGSPDFTWVERQRTPTDRQRTPIDRQPTSRDGA